MSIQPGDKVRVTRKPDPIEGLVTGVFSDAVRVATNGALRDSMFNVEDFDFEITEKRVPQLGEVWYFTSPVLGIGFVCQAGVDSKKLQVRFRAGGQYLLDECDAAELMWRD